MANPEAKPPAAAAAGKPGDKKEVQFNTSVNWIVLPEVDLHPVLARLSNPRVERNSQWPLCS